MCAKSRWDERRCWGCLVTHGMGKGTGLPVVRSAGKIAAPVVRRSAPYVNRRPAAGPIMVSAPHRLGSTPSLDTRDDQPH